VHVERQHALRTVARERQGDDGFERLRTTRRPRADSARSRRFRANVRPMRRLLLLAVVGCSSSPTPQPVMPGPTAEAPPPATPAPAPAAPASRYPAAPRGNVVETHHGVQVADPYRWLEAMDSPQTRAWIDAENKLADAQLLGIRGRDKLRARIAELQKFERYGIPDRGGKRRFWYHHDGGMGQGRVETATTLDAPPTTVLDANDLSKDGSRAFAGMVPSPNGAWIAYGVSAGGGDWQTWHIRDVATGKDVADELPNIKYYEPVFTPDSKGVYYSRFPAPAPGTELTATDKDCKVYLHTIGTPADKDVVVYERTDQPTWQFQLERTPDDRYLVISIGDGQVGDSGKEQISYLELGKKGAKPVSLIDVYDAEYVLAGSDGTVLYFQTNLDAPLKRVIAIDVAAPKRDRWKTIVPEGTEAVDGVSVAAKQLYVTRLRDAHAVVTVHDLKGKKLRDVALPGLGTVRGFKGAPADKELFYYFADFTVPGTIMRYDVASGASKPWHAPKVAFDPGAFETRQVFFPSKDGTKVPMFVTGKKGFALDGAHPTIMTAYGFGGVSILPFFDPSAIAWLERGGLTVLVNIRGGGEYGEAWHRASMKTTRQVGLDDFIAAGEFLIANKYTSTPNLGVTGASGGGMLVGAATVQRPDLYGASVPVAGVHDLLRFQLFGQGAGWQADMGSPDVAEEFPALYKFSPYHNAKPARYPPMLIITSDHDVRVAPLHSYKYAAALQYAQQGDAPIVLRVETESGHGGGSTLAQKVEQRTESLAFFATHLGLPLD
jgi:prolyl oligopeptidase